MQCDAQKTPNISHCQWPITANWQWPNFKFQSAADHTGHFIPATNG